MDSKTYFYLTLLGGWSGIHKFVTGKIKMGLIYLFTFGLFGIGWLYDIIKASSFLNKPYTTKGKDAIDIFREKSDIYIFQICKI